MSKWQEVTLGEIFKVKHGFAFKGEYFTEEPQSTVLVTPGNFAIGGGFQDGKRKYYNGPVPEDYVLSPGQVVVTMTDLSKESDTLGYAASIPNDANTWLHNQRVGLLEFKPAVPTAPRFIQYLLRTHDYRSWVVGSATGTTVKHTSPGRIESFKTRIPSIGEQHAIAQILGALDDKIELNRRMNETLEAMARVIFQSWFVDFDPVRAKASGESADSICQRLGLTPELLALFPDSFEDSELGDIPLGWGVASLEEFCELNAKSWSAKTLPDEVHYVDLANTKNGVIQEVQNLAKSEAPSRAKRVLRAGDTVIGTVRPGNRSFAFIGERDIQLTGSTGFAVLSPKEVYFAEFVYLVSTAKDNIDRLTRLADGGAYPAVSPEVIVETTCVRPKTDVSMAFHEICGSLMTKFDANILSNIALTDVRDELLPKLLSGSLGLDGGEAL